MSYRPSGELSSFANGQQRFFYDQPTSLPSTTVSQGHTTRYDRFLTGAVAKTVAPSGSRIAMVGPVEFVNGQPSRVHTAEGYYDVKLSRWVFAARDYLGTPRAWYTDRNGDGRITYPDDVLEERTEYPFGQYAFGWHRPEAEHLAAPEDFTGHGRVGVGQLRGVGQSAGEAWTYSVIDMRARMYVPAVGLFGGVDLLAGNIAGFTPYHYVHNNPVNLVDPTGMSANAPVYGTDGAFLGTDDQGLQGKGIVMDAANFTQGMSHESALASSLGPEALSADNLSVVRTHMAGLSSRPDFDGRMTISEGIDWGLAHPNALANPTPDNSVYINAASLDFGYIFESDFAETGVPTPVNLFNARNMQASVGSSDIRNTTYALGRVNLILNDRQTRSVSVVNDAATDYDWNRGGGAMRQGFIDAERLRTGLNDTHGFRANYYGTGRLPDQRRRELGLDRMP